MPDARLRFADFVVDRDDRSLSRGGRRVALNPRYLDALILLVSEPGKLVTKERFLETVWRGAPVTDEAQTQCVRTLRRLLGDDAARPAFIETVPKHGYRFIAPVTADGPASAATRPEDGCDDGAVHPEPRRLIAAGAGGGAAAGLLGGLFYGLAATTGLGPGDGGATSTLLVVVTACVFVATLGGAAVMAGAAFARRFGPAWAIAGGALGGGALGGAVVLIGGDALRLLLGHAPANLTGPGEGLTIGAAIGAAHWCATLSRAPTETWMRGALGAVFGAVAGLLIAWADGSMMSGSIEALARAYPTARLGIDALTDVGFPLLNALEGALFAGLVVASSTISPRAPPR
jgi:DNA-binding winged helix-turn-helix (wHTH) protein